MTFRYFRTISKMEAEHHGSAHHFGYIRRRDVLTNEKKFQAICSCGWRATARHNEGFRRAPAVWNHSRATAKIQWERHIRETPDQLEMW